MAYDSSLDDFKPRDPKKGDSVLMAFLDADGQVKYVTAANPLPSTPGVGATEATQLLVEANTSPSAGPLAGAAVVVATAGTRVQLSAVSVPCKAVLIQMRKAAGANTGVIYIGGAGVTSANAVSWAAGSVVTWECDDVSDLWIDASVNADGVIYQPIAKGV